MPPLGLKVHEGPIGAEHWLRVVKDSVAESVHTGPGLQALTFQL